MQQNEHPKGKTLTLITLIIAAETIYMLPFVLVRVFRPTLLDLFGISNTELKSLPGFSPHALRF